MTAGRARVACRWAPDQPPLPCVVCTLLTVPTQWQGETGKPDDKDGKGGGAGGAGSDGLIDPVTVAAVLVSAASVYLALGVMHGRAAGRRGVAACPGPLGAFKRP